MRKKNEHEWYKPLEPHFKKRMPIERFAKTEAMLHLLSVNAPDADPQKAYLLFARYHVIGTSQCTAAESQLERARRSLGYYRSKKYWQDDLRQYLHPDYDALRAFVIDTSQDSWTFKRNAMEYPYPYERRQSEWEEELWNQPSAKRDDLPMAETGTYFYVPSPKFMESEVRDRIPVTFHRVETPKPAPRTSEKGARTPIHVPIGELLECAGQMKEMGIETHSPDVLSKTRLLSVENGKTVPADALHIHGVTNIIGMVGSGKSTLIKVLAFWANQHQKRVVIVMDTVAEAFQLWGVLHKAGVSCSPLIGHSDRLKYINQLAEENQTCLSPNFSEYLTTFCPLDGMDENREDAVAFGEEPCYSLKLKKSGKSYLCPYFDACPGARMLRECYEKSVVITTAQGFAAIKVGKNREAFANLVLDAFDMAIFDECDRVQKTLDQYFLPETRFDEYIRECGPDCGKFMQKESQEREKNPAELRYNELQRNSVTVMSCVLDSLRRNDWKRINDGDSFSALTLLEALKEELPEEIRKNLYDLMDSDKDLRKNLLADAFYDSCRSTDSARFDSVYGDWAESQKETILARSPKNVDTLHERIKLILRLIFFDRFIHDLADADAARETLKVRSDLFSFLRTRFQEQQYILPSALCGNLFGMKKTDKDDIVLFRQYAFGRSLMKDLPYLRTAKDGAALGPHALLLSGSSWAPGSYEYHINRPVHYILDAGADKRAFLERTRFEESGFPERVSGTSGDKKNETLSALTRKTTDWVIQEYERNAGKILLVVNSYDQAAVTQDALRSELKRRGHADKIKAYRMIRDNTDASGVSDSLTIRRGEVYKFAKMDADILIAPAMAIERGHNIVDDTGHSALGAVFFMVRPLPVPDDLQERGSKLNGYIEAHCPRQLGETAFAYHLRIRKEAAAQWRMMNERGSHGLNELSEDSQRDVVATLFVLILQIFGRLARVTDTTRPEAHVYFMDGAFRRPEGRPKGFDCLNRLRDYLKELMNNPESAETAKALYEPFYKAYEEGIHE